MKKSSECGKMHGVSSEMMLADIVKSVWLAFFQCYREDGIAPTLWWTSLVVPVPKKRYVECATQVDALKSILYLLLLLL